LLRALPKSPNSNNSGSSLASGEEFISSATEAVGEDSNKDNGNSGNGSSSANGTESKGGDDAGVGGIMRKWLDMARKQAAEIKPEQIADWQLPQVGG
jgi:hypothetical protein